MSDPLQAELDALFQLPPGALVEARGALAERLKRAGEREAAARVKSIKRPPPAAWAINQVFFRQPALLQRALDQAAAVRALHARDGVEAKALSAAVEAQRAATQAVVDSALKLAEAAGQSTGAALQRKVLATLQGWLTGMGDEPPGRMTHELESAGFGAVVTVGAAPRALPRGALEPATIAAPGPLAKKVAPSAAQALAAERAARLSRAKDLLADRERALREARQQQRLRAEAETRAREALTRTQNAVQEAEKALAELRRKQQKQELTLQEAQRVLAEAEAAALEADELASRARDEHDVAQREPR